MLGTVKVIRKVISILDGPMIYFYFTDFYFIGVFSGTVTNQHNVQYISINISLVVWFGQCCMVSFVLLFYAGLLLSSFSICGLAWRNG